MYIILAQANPNDVPLEITEMPEGEQTTTTTPSDTNVPVTGERPGFSIQSLLPIILIFIVMYFFLFRGPKKRDQEHKKMVQSLKKNDKVRTIGGIIGTVVDIRDDEVVLKIDEANNTKIRVIASAIGKNMSTEKQ